jgi:uncharacterized protein (DUF1499 family)
LAELALHAGFSRLGRVVAWLGLSLAVLSAVMLALVPLGWRLGLWHFRVSFFDLMEPAAFIGAAAFLISLIALVWWNAIPRAARLATMLGIVGGALLFGYPAHFYALVRPLPLIGNTPVPPIDDITTDPANPPQFEATLAARASEHGKSAVYSGPALARKQQAGYPDIVPLETARPPAEVFRRALAAAEGMPRWTIVKQDPKTGIIEGSARTFFMGFTDDFVIRVSPNGPGSRVDMRSESRQGTSDLGTNAARIRGYMAALKAALS